MEILKQITRFKNRFYCGFLMRNIVNYAIAGIASLYLAFAPATLEATSGYEKRFENYKPKFSSNKQFNGAVIVRGIQTKITDLPLELLSEIPVIEETKSLKSYTQSFLPIRLDEMPEKGKIR